jgi:hypothetical protein
VGQGAGDKVRTVVVVQSASFGSLAISPGIIGGGCVFLHLQRWGAVWEGSVWVCVGLWCWLGRRTVWSRAGRQTGRKREFRAPWCLGLGEGLAVGGHPGTTSAGEVRACGEHCVCANPCVRRAARTGKQVGHSHNTPVWGGLCSPAADWGGAACRSLPPPPWWGHGTCPGVLAVFIWGRRTVAGAAGSENALIRACTAVLAGTARGPPWAQPTMCPVQRPTADLSAWVSAGRVRVKKRATGWHSSTN